MKLSTAIILVFVVLLWGSSFTILKLGLEKIPPITLASLRFLITLPLLIAFAYMKKSDLGITLRRNWRTFSILGLTGITLCHILQNFGLKFATVSNASLIITSNPIYIALIGHYYLKEKFTSRRIFGIAIAFFGVILVIRPLEWSLNPLSLIGNLLCLGTALSWASYSILSRKILIKYDVNQVTTSSIIFGTLFLLPIAFTLEKPTIPASIEVWFLLLFLSLLCSGLGYLLWNKALEDAPATEVSVFEFFIPVTSILIAHFVLSESIDHLLIYGAILIMLGVFITEYTR
ncbi:DMT family transporter [[Eubacterium] cellulosolvens]